MTAPQPSGETWPRRLDWPVANVTPAIQFDPADYWKWRSLQGDAKSLRDDAVKVVEQVKAQIAEADARLDAFSKELAEKYPAFQPEGASYQGDDASCVVTPC